jgi:hypothetical protein
VALAIPVVRGVVLRLVAADGCSKTMFEYNLIPFPPTLQNRFGSISANSTGSDETCKRGKETQIANQQ